MIAYVGDYAFDADWAAGVVGWGTRVYTGNTLVPARHVTLAEVVAGNPAWMRDEILRKHREALTLLALCQAKLQLELDNVEGMP